ncbi:MAG: PAS domain S-box protein [Leptothrix sp. (in: b-proteobacteria)]
MPAASQMNSAEAHLPIIQALRDDLGLAAILAVLGLVIAYALARHGLTLAERRDVARVSHTLDRMVRGCALAVLGLGLVVLAGWALQIEALKSGLPGLIPMHPNTALGFMLAGIALAQRQRHGVRLSCAAAMLALGGLVLVQQLSGVNFGLDQHLFGTPSGPIASVTAANFMLLGSALLLLGTRRTALRRSLEGLALLAGLLALIALIGYAYNTDALYRLAGSSIAMPTALGFVILALGVLSARPDGLAGVFAGPGLGGQVARRFLPLMLMATLTIGWLVQMGKNTGLLTPTQDTAVFAVAMVLVLALYAWWHALLLDSSDTERQQAEALRRSVVETAPNGLLIVNGGGAITLVNTAMERLFGYTRQELLGQPVELLLPEPLRDPHQQLRAGFMVNPPAGVMDADRDLCGRRKDGSEFPIEVRLSAIQTEAGPGVLASIIDISARQQAENKLREREALLATLTDRARVGMVMVTAERRYVFANTAYAEVLGLSIADIVGRRVPDVLASVYERQVRPKLDRAFAGESVTYDLKLPPLPDGAGERHFAITYDPPVDTVHGPCVIVLVIDITERKRADELRRESEERYRSLFDGSLDAIFSLGTDGHFVTANPAAQRLVGKPLEQLQALHFLDLCAPDQRATAAEAFRGAFCRQCLTLETAVIGADGTRHAIYISGAPAIVDDQVVGVSCIGRDITERKLRERDLAFLTELQKLFADLTSTEDILRLASERIARYFDLKHCLLMEIDPAAEHATLLHDHHAADVVGLSGVYRIADFQTDAERRDMEVGRTVAISDVHLDGRTAERIQQFEALGIGSLVNAPYLAQGRWKFLLSVLRAEPHAWSPEETSLLTELAARLYVRLERARTEEQLRASEERTRLAAEAAEFGMYDRDMSGTDFHTSPKLKQMLGYAADEPLPHQQVMTHFHPDDRAVGVAAFQRACDPASDGRIAIEQRILRRDGVMRWISTIGQVLFKDGVPDRSLGFWVDITARKEADELRRTRDEAVRAAAEVTLASKYKSEFLANMSHELRTPLNSLLILSKVLADNKGQNLSAKQVEYAQTVYQSGSDLLHLINEILDLAKIEAGRVEVHIDVVPLATLCQRTERNFRHVAQSRKLDFSVSLDPQLPASIDSDVHRLDQVLKNLLANSFKFTAKGHVKLAIHRASEGWGRPHASLDQADGVIAFAVTDSGIGIASDKQLLIFEAFAQADGSTSRQYGGTGLGLSISRELARLLGGAIALHSEPGVGSTFTLYLPFTHTPAPSTLPAAATKLADRPAITLSPAPGAVAAEPDPAANAALAGKKVLVVDDDMRNVYALVAILEGANIEFGHAQSGPQCLALLATTHFDAVLMDIMMPGMDGYQTMQGIRAMPGLAALPIIAVTAKAMPGDREKCLEAGACDYLTKPVNADQLLALLRRWLDA